MYPHYELTNQHLLGHKVINSLGKKRKQSLILIANLKKKTLFFLTAFASSYHKNRKNKQQITSTRAHMLRCGFACTADPVCS